MKSTLGLSALAVLMSATAALAEFPEKPVEFVVPFPPGDLEDILTRMIADEFQAMVSAYIERRWGAKASSEALETTEIEA